GDQSPVAVDASPAVALIDKSEASGRVALFVPWTKGKWRGRMRPKRLARCHTVPRHQGHRQRVLASGVDHGMGTREFVLRSTDGERVVPRRDVHKPQTVSTS